MGDGLSASPPRIGSGERLGPYTVSGLIGAGGMGEVYRAHDPRLRRDVAIKVLPADADREREHRLLDEAQAAGALNHPNILTVYDVGTHTASGPGPAVAFIVMELVEGHSLRERLQRGPLPIATVIDIATQIAGGLVAAHDKGIVHRDLKPENLFLTPGGLVKILDFGLARQTPAPAAAAPGSGNTLTLPAPTAAGSVLGTAPYMSPEQVRGEPADVRADIFAFGAVIYELVTGRRAFAGASPIDTMTSVLRDDPPPMTAPREAVPPMLERVVRRCLQKTRDARFQSARDLAFALAEVARDSSADPPLRAAAAARWRRRSPAMVVGLAVVLILLAWQAGLFRRSPAPVVDLPIRSLAVLPLQSRSKDVEEYFADGMTESLISSLAHLSGVRVISRTSAMTYKAGQKPLPEIARELHVDAILEGEIRRAGGRVVVLARLFDGRTERAIWSNQFERDARDVLAIEADIAQAIAREIRATLTPQQTARLAGAPPIDTRAHEAFLRGRYFLNKGSEADITKAIAEFTQATTLASGYAPPYAGLADAYTLLRSVHRSPHEVMPLARAAAQKALDLDPALAEAHLSMGGVLMFYDFDWPAAEAQLKRAIELSPSLGSAHSMYALYLAALGRFDQARAESALAQELDPLSLFIMNDAGFVHYLARDYQRSVAVNQKALGLDVNFWPAHRDLGLGYEKLGRFADAIGALKKARQIDVNSSVLEMLGGAYAAAGQVREARQVLTEVTRMAEQKYICPYEVATIHAGLGDIESTLAWLEKGIEARADCMPWARSDVKLDGLRANPRFQTLMGRIGLRDK